MRCRMFADIGVRLSTIQGLGTARDLFAQQGDQEGFQIADQLIQHFAGSLESETNQEF